jgi:hypothetical protein
MLYALRAQEGEELREPRTWLVDLPREGGGAGRNRAFEVVLAHKAELRVDDLREALGGKPGPFPQHIVQARQPGALWSGEAKG